MPPLAATGLLGSDGAVDRRISHNQRHQNHAEALTTAETHRSWLRDLCESKPLLSGATVLKSTSASPEFDEPEKLSLRRQRTHVAID
jgi:hypothetical protein